MTHQCPVTGCWRDGRPGMCRKHWHLVPTAIQHQVQAAWGDGSGEGSIAHCMAMQAALEAVSRRIATRGE